MTKSQVINLTNTTTNNISASTSKNNEDKPNPNECLEKGLWEVELVYYNISNGHRSIHNTLGVDPKHRRRGKVYKCLTDNEYKCFESHDDIIYWPGDCVYLESTPNEPYVVATITSFKPAKREQISMKLTRYYRPEDIPEVTYSLLIQERKEHNVYDKMLEYESRELFQNEISCTYPISYLRGKCTVKSYRNISELDEENILKDNAFFTCLNYNLDSNRLAAFHGTIRQGARHQAELPPWPTESVSEDNDRDQLLYKPGEVCQESEEQYIKGCRAYRTLCLNRKPMIPQIERDSRLGDLLFDDAIMNLHICNYNIDNAKKIMEEHDNQLAEDNSFLTADDVKKFTKGIKNYGKNFSKIQRELLPYHMREHLVNFYYMWKKSRDATRPRAIQRTRFIPKKAFKNGTPLRPASADLIDYDSLSEDELPDTDRACHHCYTMKSKDWHHAGIHRQLMCTDCRLHFKKYGNLRNVERPSTVPLCLHRGSPTDEGVRTRANGKNRRNIDSPLDEKSSRKSRKRLHRHSAMSDELTEVDSPKTNGNNNKKKANSEPKEGENSGSDTSTSDNKRKKKINGYQSSSSSASSPGIKEDTDENHIKKENGIEIKQEIINGNDIKDNKENIIKKEKNDDEEDDEEYCLLEGEKLLNFDEENINDNDEKISKIIKKPENNKKEPLLSNIGQELPITSPTIFEQIIERKSKNTCSRTDFIYHNPNSISWTQKRKIREEKDKEQLLLERKRREEEEERQKQQLRSTIATSSTINMPSMSIPTTSSMLQNKNSLDMLNNVNNIGHDQMNNVLQRIQMGAIPPPMSMVHNPIDPRLFVQQQQLGSQQFMMMLQQHHQQQEQKKLQEAQRQAEQKRIEEQKRIQELQRQREAAAVQAAQMNGVKVQPPQTPNPLMMNPQLQLMMNPQLIQNNSLLMNMMQHAQMAAVQDYERKRMEAEIMQRTIQMHQQQQQQQQAPASAALNHFTTMLNNQQNGQVPTSMSELQLMMTMMHSQQQQHQQQLQHQQNIMQEFAKYGVK